MEADFVARVVLPCMRCTVHQGGLQQALGPRAWPTRSTSRVHFALARLMQSYCRHQSPYCRLYCARHALHNTYECRLKPGGSLSHEA